MRDVTPPILRDQIQIDAEFYRRSYRDFFRGAWSNLDPAEYVHGWHIDIICDYLSAVAHGEITKLIINIPPRHCKSIITCAAFPPWVWTWRQSCKFFSTSYAADLAMRDAVKSRNLIRSKWYQEHFPEVQIRKDQDTKTNYANVKGGIRISSSVGGLLTGEGADIFIVDDPHNVKEAESDIVRAETVRWWTEGVSTRLNQADKSARIIIQQRLHEGDLAGEMLSTGEYDHLVLPAEYDPTHQYVFFDDIRGYDGELLWPERFDRPAVDELKKSLGSYGAAGQLQQEPSPRGGGMFREEWLQIIETSDLPHKFDKVVNGWDFAASDEKKKKGDWTCRVKAARRRQWDNGIKYTNIYILHVKRFKKDENSTLGMVKTIVQSDGVDIENDMPEDPGAAGKLNKKYLRTILEGFALVFSLESGAKETRAQGLATHAENLRVFLLKGDWNQDFIDELKKFPAGKWDDQVDAASRAFHNLMKMEDNQKTQGQPPEVEAATNLDPGDESPNQFQVMNDENIGVLQLPDNKLKNGKIERSRLAPIPIPNNKRRIA